jgi:hypothetical protein
VSRAIEELYPINQDLTASCLPHEGDWPNAQTFLLGDDRGEHGCRRYRLLPGRSLLQAFDESSDSPGSHDQVKWFVAATEPFWLARCLGDLLDSAQIFHEKVSAACGSDPRTWLPPPFFRLLLPEVPR